jgi:hypothetical protein
MQIDKIITLANSKVRLRFLALERSLRATGCQLPLWVIPYDDNRFDLPENSFWWEVSEITDWLKSHGAHPMMRKYQCLTIGNYQFVDSDVIFLSNPQYVLQNTNDFVTSCGHWHNPDHTYTSQSLKVLQQQSTLWQKNVFNAGQFACDKPLYAPEDLKIKAEFFKYTCLLLPYHDQPGLNLLVNTSGITINNLTLPPYRMESTWAGDYNDQGFKIKWNEQNKPYLIHWAGCHIKGERAIDELFYCYLTTDERDEWNKIAEANRKKEKNMSWYLRSLRRKLKKIYQIVKE